MASASLWNRSSFAILAIERRPSRVLPKCTQSDTLEAVKQILWDTDKNDLLQRGRGICFEDVLLALEKAALLDNLEHPNQDKYPGQRIMIVRIENYVCLVPYIETKECVLLKTIIPSRKATKKHLGRQGDMNEADQ
jgi:uncharacterized DUF497 family protein